METGILLGEIAGLPLSTVDVLAPCHSSSPSPVIGLSSYPRVLGETTASGCTSLNNVQASKVWFAGLDNPRPDQAGRLLLGHGLDLALGLFGYLVGGQELPKIFEIRGLLYSKKWSHIKKAPLRGLAKRIRNG
jgi:hypothetical protein